MPNPKKCGGFKWILENDVLRGSSGMENPDGIDEEPRVAGFEDVFDFRPGMFGRRETTGEEEDLMVSLQEIQKMDAVLKVKVTEEKRAKLSRIQAEEESRDILSKLPHSGMPDRIAVNLEKFMRLLIEVSSAETDPAPRCKSNEVGDVERQEPDDEGMDKGGKTCRRQQNAGGLTFVERNIRLAKCGRGTLSLTDEEKSRIENLLADVVDLQSKTNVKTSKETKVESENEKEESYAIDDETKSVLRDIDRRLQVLTKPKTSEEDKGIPESLERSDAEGKRSSEAEHRSRDKKEGKKKGDRLEEINKLLNSMNLVSDEEIRPLSEEEMASLVRRSKETLSLEKGIASEGGGGECSSGKPPADVITELVSGAKLLMPKFKYRFEDA